MITRTKFFNIKHGDLITFKSPLINDGIQSEIVTSFYISCIPYKSNPHILVEHNGIKNFPVFHSEIISVSKPPHNLFDFIDAVIESLDKDVDCNWCEEKHSGECLYKIGGI